MIEIKTKIAEDGNIVVPAEYLQAMGLEIGDDVILRFENGVLDVFTPRQAIKFVQEALRPYLPEGRSLSDELIAERRLED